jgi:hypothetical protein
VLIGQAIRQQEGSFLSLLLYVERCFAARFSLAARNCSRLIAIASRNGALASHSASKRHARICQTATAALAGPVRACRGTD